MGRHGRCRRRGRRGRGSGVREPGTTRDDAGRHERDCQRPVDDATNRRQNAPSEHVDEACRSHHARETVQNRRGEEPTQPAERDEAESRGEDVSRRRLSKPQADVSERDREPVDVSEADQGEHPGQLGTEQKSCRGQVPEASHPIEARWPEGAMTSLK